MASVEWGSDALHDLQALDRSIAKRIVGKAIWFEKHFSDTTPDPLHNVLKGLYKFRVGDYRVIYSIRGEHITIEAICHHSRAYKS